MATHKSSRCRIIVFHGSKKKEFPFTVNGMRKAAAIGNGYAKSRGSDIGRHVSAAIVCTKKSPFSMKTQDYESMPIFDCTRRRCEIGDGNYGKAGQRYVARRSRARKGANTPLAGMKRRKRK